MFFRVQDKTPTYSMSAVELLRSAAVERAIHDHDHPIGEVTRKRIMEYGQSLPINVIEAKEDAAHDCFRLTVIALMSLCFPRFSRGMGTSNCSSCVLGGVCYLQRDRDDKPLRLPIEGKATIDGESYSLAYSLPATGFSFEVQGQRGGSMLFEIDDDVLARQLPSCARAGWTDLRICGLCDKNIIAVAGRRDDEENATVAIRADRSN